MNINSIITPENIVFIADIYRKYLLNSASIDCEWTAFFEQAKNNGEDLQNLLLDIDGPSWQKRGLTLQQEITTKEAVKPHQAPAGIATEVVNLKIKSLISAYIKDSHLCAKINPLGGDTVLPVSLLLQSHGLSDDDFGVKINNAQVGSVISHYNQIFCGTVGVECDYLDPEERGWLLQKYQEQIVKQLSNEEKQSILENLTKATIFEQYLNTKFTGAKRFSIEGGEGYVVLLESSIVNLAKFGVGEIMIGMAHRGRLNSLVNSCNKPVVQVFREFSGQDFIPTGTDYSGDVKYHAGYRTKRKFQDVQFSVEIMANPSHLEAINSVALGRVRARQDAEGNQDASVAILVHGDAAMAGQGSVAEVFSMSQLDSCKTGGTIHIAINNQIGFTANPNESRSSRYCTDIAKSINAPIFHVNGEDAESCYKLGKVVAEYRQKFRKDIVVDVVCYRKYGHNEGDEPNYTQPQMYSKIAAKTNTMDLYIEQLLEEKSFTKEEILSVKNSYKLHLDEEFEKISTTETHKPHWLKGRWQEISANIKLLNDVSTKISEQQFEKIMHCISTSPKEITPHPKVVKLLESRSSSVAANQGLDWSCGELLAYGSLMMEGSDVRLCGQDSMRGTFSHRHAILTDVKTQVQYNLLSGLGVQKKLMVYNSFLSEFAALGFEYGYSLFGPKNLTIWEAQFGDFANGGNVILDQFISSAESKWLQLSGMIILLPHGFEGQGPEHSSARLERYLQACAEDNLIVANCTTPANIFHIIRRQILSKTRKPLIIMTPKSLLRHKMATSIKKDFTEGCFQAVINTLDSDDAKIDHIIITSGKIYYDILAKKQTTEQENIAIIRLEQYYPFPQDLIIQALNGCPNATKISWVQEEPQNMGAWHFVKDYLVEAILSSNLDLEKVKKTNQSLPITSNNDLIVETRSSDALLRCVARRKAASPATGCPKRHKIEEIELLKQSLR